MDEASSLDERAVPRLSADDIELKAEEVIQYFDKGLLKRPVPLPPPV